MKKWLLVLGMITCMAGLTACGQKAEEADSYMPAQEAQAFATDLISVINDVVAQQAEADYVMVMEQSGIDGAIFENAFASWKSASEDMGNYVEVIEITGNTMTVMEYQGMKYPDEGVVTAKIKGDVREASVEIIYEEGLPTSITTNVIYTFGESMEKAALNTLLGMGTVFVVLILISVIIACFNFIPKIQGMFKKKAKEDIKAEAVDNTIAQIIEKEELADDLELVAVIAAAIAASEGAASTDGFVVRSIKRRKARA